MANDYELSIDIAAPPDAVWTVIGDPAGVPKWFPRYAECTVDGTTRTLVSVEGHTLVEELRARDEEERFYSYRVTSGAPLKTHSASFHVVPNGDGSRVIWHTRGEYEDPTLDIETRLSPAQAKGLENLKALVESGG